MSETRMSETLRSELLGTAGLTVAAIVAALLTRSRRREAVLFPAWFLAIASVANGIAHPALALATGSYFPGLWTSPLMAAGGVLLWRRLMTITARA